MKYLVAGKVLDGNDEIPNENFIYAEYEQLPFIAFCTDCDKVLYPCRTEAGAKKVCDKHMGYKKYAGHNAEIRYEKTVCKVQDILGTEANRNKTEQFKALFAEKLKQKREAEEKELMPKIEKIVEALGVEYKGQAQTKYTTLYTFKHKDFHFSSVEKMDIEIAYDQIMGEKKFKESDTLDDVIKMVWFRISDSEVYSKIPESTNRSVFVEKVVQ